MIPEHDLKVKTSFVTHYNQHKKTAYLFILPQLVVTLLFFIWPSIKALTESLFYSDPFGITHHFAGLSNFTELAQSPDYFHAVAVTFILAGSITGLTLTFGLILSVLVGASAKPQFFKSLLIWPYAIAPAVAAILWRFLCHPTLGWIAQGLHSVGVDFNYMIHPKQALLVVILTASWQQFSYNFLFLFAALKMIPQSILEAAIIDGASPWNRFWQIKFPLLMPTFFYLLIINVMYSFFETFGIIHVMTSGGPGLSTTNLMYKVYLDGFVGMDLGSSSAQSIVLMGIVIALTLIQFYYLEKRVHYQ